MTDTATRILFDALSWYDRLWAAICVLVCVGGLWLVKTIVWKPEKRLPWQVGIVTLSVLIIACEVLIHRYMTSLNYVFPSDVSGILVLRIVGDDDSQSLQRDLVSSLNTELAKEFAGEKVEVHGFDKWVDENMLGVDGAHREARKFGERCMARLVIWGDRVGMAKFHPRITIVREPESRVIAGKYTLPVQDISQLNLPVELISEPMFLAQFCLGYGQYRDSNYRQAIGHFRAAIALKGVSQDELADTRFFAGVCLRDLSQGQMETPEYLSESIDDFQAALTAYGKTHAPLKRAMILNNLGAAYIQLPIGDRATNFQKAIDCFTAALQVQTQATFPYEWAGVQNNLGTAYIQLPTGNREANFQKAIDCFKAALQVRTQATFPHDWAGIQINLGTAYSDLLTGDRAANLQKAIYYYTAALRVLTEATFPRDWALIQQDLGAVYDQLPIGDRPVNFQKAIDYYTAALRVLTEASFPYDWADTQVNLGNAYGDLPTGDQVANLQKAIDCFTVALRVLTEAAFPQDWARAQVNLGAAYSRLPTGDQAANFQKAIDYYTAALRVLTEAAFPHDWAHAQINLGAVYIKLPTGDPEANLRKAIDYNTAALRVLTEAAFPHDWAQAQVNLGAAYSQLPTGDQVANFQKAIDYYMAALRVQTEAAFPHEWAMTQFNLGLVLLDLAGVTKDRTFLRRAEESFVNSARGLTAIGMRGEAEWALQKQAEVNKLLETDSQSPKAASH